MDGIGSTARNTINNVNQTVHHVGTASATAAREAPIFNDNMNNLNLNAASGISSFNKQAGQLNETATRGLGIFDQQAASGISSFNNQAGQLNDTATCGLGMFDQQAGDAVGEINALNKTAANGLRMFDQQADEVNKTASEATEEVARVASSFESTSEVVNSAIEMWAPNISTFLQILGPLQYILAADCFVLILKTLSVVQAKGSDAQAWKELRVSNAILQCIVDDNREKNIPGIVQNITKKSIVNDMTTKTVVSYFFHSKSNIIAEQLRGLGYYAYDSIQVLFEKVYHWNAFADAANETDSTILNKFSKRHSRIHFLDPIQNPQVMLSHMEFTKIHQNVTIINHHKAQQHVTLRSIKVHEGCCLTLEHVSVCKIDATNGGKAILRQCRVGWDQVAPHPVPFLFGGRPEKFDNPYNVCGNVDCGQCTTFDPSMCNSKWKGLKGVFKRPSGKYVSLTQECKYERLSTLVKVTIERTITNISDEVWHVRFKEIDGVVRSCDGSTQILETVDSLTLSPGDSTSFSVTIVYASRLLSTAKASSGSLIFVDKNGNEYWHAYKGLENLTNYTITCPLIKCANVCNYTTPLQERVNENGVEDTTHPDNEEKKSTIVVVGRFGSGKSTFLNALAGVNWIVQSGEAGDRKFSVVEGGKEKFAASRSIRGCTKAAVSEDIITFDGREFTVIDTVGYGDDVNAEIIYNDSKLTEVMDQYKHISAIVIVVNSQEPRLTLGFMESLACVPTSFKANVQKNIVLMFTKWTEDDEEDNKDKPFRGFTEQVTVIRSVLGFDDEDEIKAFWVDNRPFKEYNERACRTIHNLTSFLDHVAELPRLSCPEFKEMRALSQCERVVRKEFQQYFLQSNQNETNPNGFEKFLFKCAKVC